MKDYTPNSYLELNLSAYEIKLLRDHTKSYTFSRIGAKSTVCVLVMNNYYEVIGTSACVNPNDFNLELGRKYSLLDAIKKADQLVGYEMHQKLIDSKQLK